MRYGSSGRALAYYHSAVVCVVALPFLLLLLSGCREQIPSGPTPEPANPHFTLPLNSYYSYDNWKLYPNGSRILASQFRNSWKVADTGAIAIGYSDVTIIVDSTFSKDVSGADSLIQTEHRYFRTSSTGDVFEFGFIARLLRLRDTLLVSPQWDRLFSPSAGANTSWIVETNDTASVGTFSGEYLPMIETVETSINGLSTGVLSYHVEITGRNFAVSLWVSNSPSAFVRLWDQSDVLYNRIFQELKVIRTSG